MAGLVVQSFAAFGKALEANKARRNIAEMLIGFPKDDKGGAESDLQKGLLGQKAIARLTLTSWLPSRAWRVSRASHLRRSARR